jgi:uncharacterized protein (TIGR00369 family)
MGENPHPTRNGQPTHNGHRIRTFSWQDPMRSAQLARQRSGMEVLQAVIDGTVGPPPIADLLGMSLVEVQEGRAVFAVEPAEWMYNPIGSVHGGIAATLLDSCMGCAIHSTLPAGVGYATSDLQIRYARGITLDTGRIVAEGTVVHGGRRLATAEGRLTAQDTGKLLAHATTACVLIS